MAQSIFDNPNSMGRQPNTTSILGGIGGGNIEQLLTMFGPMLAGMLGVKGMGGGTFGGFGDFSSLQAMEQQRRFMQMTMQSKMSQEMQNIDLMHIRSMLVGGSNMLGIHMNEQDMMSATGFLSNPMMMGALQMGAPKIAGMLFPNASSAFTSAQTLYRGGFGSVMSPGMIQGYNEGFLRGGGYDPSNPLLSVDRGMAQGFMAGERAQISAGLAARGLISIDNTGISDADMTAALSGDEAKARAIGLQVSSRTNAQLKEFVPAYGFARSVFGGEMPNMSESQVGDLLDSVTGGLGGMNKGEMMTQIARIKEITETLPITATAVKNFIDSVVGLGNTMGMTGAMSAKIAVNSLGSAQSIANARINKYGNLPGMGQFGTDWAADESTRRSMNAANASMPGDIALMADMSAGGDINRLGSDEREIFAAAQRKLSGNYTTEDFALLRNTTRDQFQRIASRMSGTSIGAVRGVFANETMRKAAIDHYSPLLEDTGTRDQLSETFMRISGRLSKYFNGGTVDEQMDALAAVTAATDGGRVDMDAVKNILGGKTGIFKNFTASSLLGLAGDSASGWTKANSALYAAQGSAGYKKGRALRANKGRASALMQEILGGISPTERLISGIKDGDITSAIGMENIGNQFQVLGGNDRWLSLISDEQSDDAFGAYVDQMSAIMPDSEVARKFREDARKIRSGPKESRRAGFKELLKSQKFSSNDLFAGDASSHVDAWRAEQEENAKSASAISKESLGDAITKAVSGCLAGLTLKIKDETAQVVTESKVT